MRRLIANLRTPAAFPPRLALLALLLLAAPAGPEPGRAPAPEAGADPSSAPAGAAQATAPPLLAAKAPTSAPPGSVAATVSAAHGEAAPAARACAARPAWTAPARATLFERFSYRTTGPPLRTA